MEVINNPTLVLYGLAVFVVGLLAYNLWFDYRWSREAQTMHARSRARDAKQEN